MIPKKIVVPLLWLLCASSLQADAFKLFAGPNLAKYSTDPTPAGSAWTYRFGYAIGAGIEFDFNFNRTAGLEIDGILLQTKGDFFENPTDDLPSASSNLSGLSIPILLKLKYSSSLPVYILGGPVLSIVFSNKTVEGNRSKDLKVYTRKLNFGAAAGVGVEFKISSFQHIFLETRYQVGLTNMFNDLAPDETLNPGAFLVLIGFKTS